MQLIIRNLTKLIDKTPVLSKIFYTFESGRIYGLVGKKNSGKTLLFICISGEEAFDRGHIRINRNGEDEKIGFMDVGCALSNSALPEFLTGYEFISHFLELHDMESSDFIIANYLKLIGIDTAAANRQIYHYTEEMKGHLQLLCVYILKPDIVLVEEHMEEYFSDTAKILGRLLNELKEKCIVILSTGNHKLIEEICNDVLMLKDGELRDTILNELSFEE